jgi:hypothetical protein
MQGPSPSKDILPEVNITRIDLWWTNDYLVGIEFTGEKSEKIVKKKKVSIPPQVICGSKGDITGAE